jgi:hypothetical protein
MTSQDVLDSLREEHETPLSRLGSSKWVYALTGGEMTSETVLAAAADEMHAAADVFDTWAASADDGDAATLFGNAADDARDHYDTVVPAEYEPADSRPPVYDVLAGADGTITRAGALLGRTLVTGKTIGQMVGFFVGDADPQTADTFRGIRTDVEDQQASVLELLDAVCVDEADWEVARAAAADVVEAAYDDYVTTLESMGVEPKNVC